MLQESTEQVVSVLHVELQSISTAELFPRLAHNQILLSDHIRQRKLHENIGVIAQSGSILSIHVELIQLSQFRT